MITGGGPAWDTYMKLWDILEKGDSEEVPKVVDELRLVATNEDFTKYAVKAYTKEDITDLWNRLFSGYGLQTTEDEKEAYNLDIVSMETYLTFMVLYGYISESMEMFTNFATTYPGHRISLRIIYGMLCAAKNVGTHDKLVSMLDDTYALFTTYGMNDVLKELVYKSGMDETEDDESDDGSDD